MSAFEKPWGREIASPNRWKVTVQNTPYNYTSPFVLVIEADTRAEAYAVAYEHLTQKGHAVGTYGPQDLGLRAENLIALGIPVDAQGNTRVRKIEEHNVLAKGRVIE